MAPTRTALALALVALVAGACDDNGANGAAGPATTSTTSSSSGQAAGAHVPPPAEGTSIADVLRSDERFSRFAEFAGRSETRIPGRPSWLDVWDWAGEQIGDDRDGVTVFAPTNDAFESADPDVIERLEGDDGNADTLRYSVLGQHYVHSLFPSSEFSAGPQRAWRGMVEMGLEPLTWGGFLVVEVDIETSNGWVHAVDGLIIPDLVQQAVDRG